MYYKNISLHLVYLQTNKKKIIFVITYGHDVSSSTVATPLEHRRSFVELVPRRKKCRLALSCESPQRLSHIVGAARGVLPSCEVSSGSLQPTRLVRDIVKKKFAKLLFFLNKTFESSIWLQNSISSKFFKNLCLYYIHLRDVMPKKLFIICKIS